MELTPTTSISHAVSNRVQPASKMRPAYRQALPNAEIASQGNASMSAFSQAGPHGSGEAVGGSAAPPAACGGSSYLETYQNAVTPSRLIACKVGCKSRFCPHCCIKLGIDLKERLIPVLSTFRRIMMLTFTVDPQHFAGPAEAFGHVKKERCVSVMMQALRRAGVLITDRWFAAIEWQENGWPHWHVLVEASFIPFEVVCDAWNVNLHKLGKSAADTRTGFGSVRFSKKDFHSPGHAANYACKYLTKHPDGGFPQWVLDSETRKVHRYSTSRGFWNDTPKKTSDVSGQPAEQRTRRTITQQLETCGQKTAVIRECEQFNTATGEVSIRRLFVRKINRPLDEVLADVPHVYIDTKHRRAEIQMLPTLADRSGNPRPARPERSGPSAATGGPADGFAQIQKSERIHLTTDDN